MIERAPPSRKAGSWGGFAASFVAVAVAALLVLWGAVAALDPFGSRTGPGRPPRPIMDVNQRYMFPQLARSGLFDSAVFGTSTIRLLDPLRLGSVLGGRFANLGLNAGTPWEQLQLAALFLRHVARPATIVFGLDRTWCEPDADRPEKRLTPRPFPPWLYDEDAANDWAPLVSLKSLEIALRLAAHEAGIMKERIRSDGYEIFLPLDASYNVALARGQIHGPPEAEAAGAAPPGARFPALDWLAGFVARLPAETRLVLMLPPVHVAAQAAPGSPGARIDAACKARIASLASDRPATAMVDFRLPNALTRDDASYWDRLHFRLPVAERLVAALAAALASSRDDPAGLYRVVSGR